jgi:hypothetical protein
MQLRGRQLQRSAIQWETLAANFVPFLRLAAVQISRCVQPDFLAARVQLGDADGYVVLSSA